MSLSRPHKPYVVTMDKVKYWFNRLNKTVFNNEIPSPRNIILVEHNPQVWGYCMTSDTRDEPKWWDIKLIRYFPTFSTFIECLAHEMVHAHCYWYYTEEYMRLSGHGRRFFSWKNQLKKVGIHLSKRMRRPEDSYSNPDKFQKLKT